VVREVFIIIVVYILPTHKGNIEDLKFKEQRTVE
jgi:hypothetical protein